MKKKLVSLLLVASLVAMTGCGGSDKNPESNGETNQSVDSTETGSSNSAADDLQDFVEDNINGENVDSAISKLNPTYKVNTTDISMYYVMNPNVSLGKSFMDITNIAKVKLEQWKGYSEEGSKSSTDFEYTSLQEIMDKYVMEDDDEQLDLEFDDGKTFSNVTVSFSGGEYVDPYNAYSNKLVMKFGDVLANGGSLTYAVGAYELHPKEVSPTILLSDVFNIDFEGNAEESLLHLKELWGEPSAIRCSKNWGITTVFWIFECDITVSLELNSVMSDEANIGTVYVTWTDSEEKMKNINTQYVDPEYSDMYWYQRADAPIVEEEYETYPANLPENIVITLGDKSVVVNKDNWKNIFVELGVTPNAEDGDRYNLDTEFKSDIIMKQLRGIEIYDKKLIIYLPNLVGTYETELAAFGINAENTLEDIFKVFGSDVSYVDFDSPDHDYYKYKELPYDGVEAIQFIEYDAGSRVIEIWWE